MRLAGVLVSCVALASAASGGCGGQEAPPADERVRPGSDKWHTLAVEVAGQNERVLVERLTTAGRSDLVPRLRDDFAQFRRDPDQILRFANQARREIGLQPGQTEATQAQLDAYVVAQRDKAAALDMTRLERAILGEAKVRPCPPYCR
jgi:hypothetical protein